MKKQPARLPIVTVFGGSHVRPGSAVWRDAYDFSRRIAPLARLYCGGYDGVMDAVAQGARAGGGGAHGVRCTALEPGSTPSPSLASHEMARDLYDRLRRLIEPAQVYVAFAGSCGTLNEVALLLAFYRSGVKNDRPLILVGLRNKTLAAALKCAGYLPETALRSVQMTAGADGAYRMVKKTLAR
jgi:hypothetical protein